MERFRLVIDKMRIADDKDISFSAGTIYMENDDIFNRVILFQPNRMQGIYAGKGYSSYQYIS